MKNKVIKYGLRLKKTGEILGFTTEPSNDSFSVGTIHRLDIHENNMWLVDEPENAEYVRMFSTDWYNASYETPDHAFKSEELEVVKVELTTETDSVEVKIPSVAEFFEIKFKEKSPDYYSYCKSALKKDNKIRYTYYDLMELKRNGKI
jgi:hypothetical protein